MHKPNRQSLQREILRRPHAQDPTNDAMLARFDRKLEAERNRANRQRAKDRDDDSDRLERIEADIRAMRDLMFEVSSAAALTDQTTHNLGPPRTCPQGGFFHALRRAKGAT